MIALINQVPSETKIKKELKKIVFGKNVSCPHCRSRQIFSFENRYRCKKCRKPFSLFSNTWLKDMKLSLRTFYAILWCWTQRIPVLQAQKLTHLSEQAVRRWYRKFRLHLPQFDGILQGVVQMDEAYFKQISLIMAKQVGDKKLAYAIVPSKTVDRNTACHFLFQYVQPNARLQTDGAGIYRSIDQWWPVKHKKDIHKKWEFELTSEIEGMFGNLRTFIRRMYHHVTSDYLPEYVSEFCLRFSSPEIFISPSHYLQKTLLPVPSW